MIYIWRWERSYAEKSSMLQFYITPTENLLPSKWISVHSYQLDDKQLSLVIYIQFLLCRFQRNQNNMDSRHPRLLLGDLFPLTNHLIRENFSTFLRPRPHVSGYFWIRNFFFPDTKISASTRYVITAYSYRIRPSTRIRIHSGFTEDWQNCPTRHWFVQV